MAKTKVSIHLFRENSTPEEVRTLDAHPINLPNGQTLYYKERPLNRPKWVASFLPGFADEGHKLHIKGVCAAIFYQVEVAPGVNRLFALTFGSGRAILRPEFIEERFGLKIVLNTADEHQLRSVDTNRLDTTPRHRRIQSSALTGQESFEMKQDCDILRNITGFSEHDILQGTLTGSAALSLSTERTYEQMDELLQACYTQYTSDAYRHAFGWVDQMQEVRQKSRIALLDNRMLEDLNSDDPQSVWMSIPEVIDWESVGTFEISRNRRYDDMTLDMLRSSGRREWTLPQLKQEKITLKDGNDSVIKSWSAHRCLYAEYTVEGTLYILNNAHWYAVSADFAGKVKSFYEHELNVATFSLPDYTSEHQDEADYNKRTAESSPDIALMDRNGIQSGGSAIEFCDLYTRNRQLVHVKRYRNSSAPLSHLFAQGLVSADGLTTQAFRALVNQALPEDFRLPDVFRAEDYEIVYAIIRKGACAGERPSIPFFSKVALRSATDHLHALGYRVSVMGIPDTSRNSSAASTTA